MKVAISLPDPVFDAAEKLASRMQVSRSQLYAQAIAEFVKTHRLDASCVNLCDAPFWNESQAHFLKEELARDANWAVVVDDLAARLQGDPPDACPVP